MLGILIWSSQSQVLQRMQKRNNPCLMEGSERKTKHARNVTRSVGVSVLGSVDVDGYAFVKMDPLNYPCLPTISTFILME